MASGIGRFAGRHLARFLKKETGAYTAFSVMPPLRLRKALRPGDVLLVEGNTRISAAIKYMTNSTWSHAAFFAGGEEGSELIEADVEFGVRALPLSFYQRFNTRICRPIDLSPEDLATVIAVMRASIGRAYDLRNVFDLARYLLPEPPVPKRWRRKMLALGSGDPSRAICSTLIAEAFGQVRYPILPLVRTDSTLPEATEILQIRHHSLYTPRDFDLSPYFRIVKPTIEADFDYRRLSWYEDGPQDASPQPPGLGLSSHAPPPGGQRAARNSGTDSRIASLSAAASSLRPEE
jgi:hypothetical protein